MPFPKGSLERHRKMGDRSRTTIYKRFLLIAAVISILYLAFMMGHLSNVPAQRHVFWWPCIGISFMLMAAASLFYGHMRVRSLKKQVAAKTEELKKSEEKYRRLVESGEDFVFTTNRSGHFQSLNNFTANFFGGTPSDFIGRPLTALFSEDVAAQQRELIGLVFQVGKSVRDEFSVTTGEHRAWFSANFMPLKDKQGKVTSVLCIARDITEKKKLEKQLVNSEKLASIGTLAAGVAHELNNPLGIILGFTDLLLEKFDKDTQNYKDLKTIERHSLQCKQVVENLLSFARHEENISEYCNINEDIHNVINVVRHFLEMKDIEIQLDLAPRLPVARGDSRQMQQVLLNLINNSAAAMEDGGVLEIKTNLDGRHNRICITVRDNGHGIKEEDLERIFDPFFTTKGEGEGTGLGLFVSHGIVTKYGGTITCESSTADGPDMRRGTTFTVMLRTATEGMDDEK